MMWRGGERDYATVNRSSTAYQARPHGARIRANEGDRRTLVGDGRRKYGHGVLHGGSGAGLRMPFRFFAFFSFFAVGQSSLG